MRESERFFTELNIKEVEFWGIVKSPLSKDQGKAKQLTGKVEPLEGLKKLRMIYNEIKEMDLYWRPYRGMKNLNIIFLDDIKEDLQAIDYITVLQTSESSFQGFIILKEEAEAELIGDIQRAVARYGFSDKGAVSPYQLRRFAGSINRKRGTPFISKIVKTGFQVSIEKVLMDLSSFGIVVKHQEEEKVSSDAHPKALSPKSPNYRKFVERDAFAFSNDESQNDFRWTMSLLKRGFSKEEVYSFLLEYSPRLYERKKKHVRDYLNRTIEKAWKFI
ncbi:MAG: hypothetical protein C0169_03205 [Thermodesulfobacterium geofontis]|uniref:RepB/MobA-like C-terminal domain-containing protein n=1 Tax=Thermodesulfobacterium geofontis TaxID=1295609 RepID=A0A2N7QF35_9BACT|nr:MAG: hypothetical protein C0169_03205 [Thermodesulfobacterium geofontis]